MRDRDRRVAGEQHEGHRLSDDRRAADDHRVFARRVDLVLVEHLHDARRGAGAQALEAAHEPAHVHGMEAVDVLVRVDGRHDLLGIEVSRQRHLDEDARDVLIGVQAPDKLHELLLRRLGGQLVVKGADAALFAIAQLGAHVGGRSLVVAHEHHGEPTRDAATAELGDLRRCALAHLRRQRLSIDNRRHGPFLSSVFWKPFPKGAADRSRSRRPPRGRPVRNELVSVSLAYYETGATALGVAHVSN